MRLILSLVVVSLFAVSCVKQPEEEVVPVVKVNDKVLTREDLNANIPTGLSPEDSIIAAEHYIRTWVNDNLMFTIASNNIVDKKNLEQLVEDYRKSLIIYQYEEQLIAEKLSKAIDNRSMLEYYEANKDEFKIDKPLIKGLFLKIPVGAPQIDKVKSWSKSITPDNIDNIEKYCVRNAVGYDYFVDDWIDFNELTETWPVEYNDGSSVVGNNKFIEEKDDNYYYFLYITACLKPKDNAPFEYAKATIKEILINQQKINFLKEVKEDLYNKAINKGQIIFYNE
jgi:PBP1b-binding outer membrane lipoprotein LpoB